MPLECVVIRCAAQNHVVSGNLERCITVPAVTEACRPQSRHSCKRGRLFSAATRRRPLYELSVRRISPSTLSLLPRLIEADGTAGKGFRLKSFRTVLPAFRRRLDVGVFAERPCASV